MCRTVPCPYFMPSDVAEQSLWPFPARLPLGAGYAGCCMAPGYERAEASESELRDFCNLGYSAGCARLPRDRTVDANRFLVTQSGSELTVVFCSERDHLPVEHGTLRFDPARQVWTAPHADGCVQRQAKCAVESFRRTGASAGAK